MDNHVRAIDHVDFDRLKEHSSSKEPQKSSSIAEKALGADMKAFLRILLQTGIATELCIRLALVHDMAECIVGDIAPADNIPKEEKHRREETAMQQLTQLLSEDLRKEIYELWEEYENQSTAEAKFVKQLDQCEMILQAFEYEELENTPGRLQDFFDSTAGKFVHPEILQLVSLINTERKKRIADTSHPHS